MPGISMLALDAFYLCWVLEVCRGSCDGCVCDVPRMSQKGEAYVRISRRVGGKW